MIISDPFDVGDNEAPHDEDSIPRHFRHGSCIPYGPKSLRRACTKLIESEVILQEACAPNQAKESATLHLIHALGSLLFSCIDALARRKSDGKFVGYVSVFQFVICNVGMACCVSALHLRYIDVRLSQ